MAIEYIPEFLVAGRSASTNNARGMEGTGVIGGIWQEFTNQNLGNALPQAIDHDVIAVYTDYRNREHGDYTFVLGKRVAERAAVPPQFAAVTIPAGRYARFVTETGPVMQTVPKLWQRIWAMSQEELGGDRAFTADYEVYGVAAANPQLGSATIYIALR